LPVYSAQSLYKTASQFKIDIGATTRCDSEYICDVEVDSDEETLYIEEFESCSDEQGFAEVVVKYHNQHELDLDNIMTSAAHARPRNDVDARHLSKVWRIDLERAQKTLDNTTQNSVCKDNPALTRNYTTNDWMLRYPWIKELFFMDTFFATQDGGKLSCGHMCCQLFVTDKGYVRVVPMKRKGEVLPAIKKFTKAVGALML